MRVRGLEVQRRHIEAEKCLARLRAVDPLYTAEYFESQWTQQKDLQKVFISVRVKEQQARLEVLLTFEESLYEARCVGFFERPKLLRLDM